MAFPTINQIEKQIKATLAKVESRTSDNLSQDEIADIQQAVVIILQLIVKLTPTKIDDLIVNIIINALHMKGRI